MNKMSEALVIISTLFFVACSNNKPVLEDEVADSITSAVQKTEVITNYTNSGQMNNYSKIIYRGDKKEKKLDYNKKKKLESYTTFGYDQNGNLMKESLFSTKDVLLSTKYYKYDEFNRVTEYFDRSEDIQEIFYTTLCEYDENDRLLKTKVYIEPVEESNLYSYSEFEYEDDLLMKMKDYLYISEEKTGKLHSYYVNEYDEEGRIYKRYFYNDKDDCIGYLIFEYNE